jgi:hypothetical protein
MKNSRIALTCNNFEILNNIDGCSFNPDTKRFGPYAENVDTDVIIKKVTIFKKQYIRLLSTILTRTSTSFERAEYLELCNKKSKALLKVGC